ncbi:unnamed protein product [Ectocarpus sp. 6 AP-2014]
MLVVRWVRKRSGTKEGVIRNSVMNPPHFQAAGLQSGHVVPYLGAEAGVGVVHMRRPEETAHPRTAKTLAKEAGKGKGKRRRKGSNVVLRPRRPQLPHRPHLRPASASGMGRPRGQGRHPRMRTPRKRTRRPNRRSRRRQPNNGEGKPLRITVRPGRSRRGRKRRSHQKPDSRKKRALPTPPRPSPSPSPRGRRRRDGKKLRTPTTTSR